MEGLVMRRRCPTCLLTRVGAVSLDRWRALQFKSDLGTLARSGHCRAHCDSRSPRGPYQPLWHNRDIHGKPQCSNIDNSAGSANECDSPSSVVIPLGKELRRVAARVLPWGGERRYRPAKNSQRAEGLEVILEVFARFG